MISLFFTLRVYKTPKRSIDDVVEKNYRLQDIQLSKNFFAPEKAARKTSKI
jgi:hypothetical protein